MSIFDDPPTPPKASIFDDAPSAPPAGYQPPSWLPGAGMLHNVSNVIDDAATFGGADALTGRGAREATQASREALGSVGSGLADVAGYAVGPGELKVGEGLARLMGGQMKARMLGSGVEGGGAAALGTVGHGDTDPADVAKSAGVGTLLGLGTGMLPGPKPKISTPSTADQKALSDAAWSVPAGMPVNPSDVGQGLAQVHLNLTPGERASMSGSLASQLNDVARETSGTNSLSADDVAKFQRSIMSAARGDADKRIAGQFSDALDTALGPAKPAVDAANLATSRFKTSKEIDKWMADPSSAPAKITAATAKKPDFYSRVAGPLASVAAYKNQTLGQKIIQQVIERGTGAAIGAGASAMAGFHPAFGALAGAARSPVQGSMATAVRNAPVLNYLKSAQHMNATGVRLPPSAFSTPSPYATIPSDILRKSGYAAGAAGPF